MEQPVPLPQRFTNAAAAVLLACLVGSASPLLAQRGDVLTVLPDPVVRTASVRSTDAPKSINQSTMLFSSSKLLLPGWALSSPEAHAVLQGRLEQAIYVERGTMPGGRIMRLSEKPDDEAPYFAVVLVPC